MLRFGTMSPDPSRSGSSTDWVGCASKNLWFGLGRPYSSGFEPVMNCIFWTSLRCQASGMCGEVTKYLSAGSPYMYFGTIHALDRVERTTSFWSVLLDSSTAMSAALLPMPTTRIRLPNRSSGVRGSM